MRNVTVLLAALLCLLAATGCGGGEPGAAQDAAQGAADTTAPEASAGPQRGETVAPSGLPVETVIIRTSGGEEVEVSAEIADDRAERNTGLMNRPEGSLPDDAGMLFVYGSERELSFWMRNTYLPLSIAYADSEGRIVDIQDMEPLDDEPPSYVSAEPARYALEVNQGFFEESGVEVGDRMELPEGVR